jgi:hypothetical protein
MIDLRYHIYSLAAVFFALAIGIVIGTSFSRRLPANANERHTIQRYENSMRVLKREIESVSQSAAQKEKIAEKYEEFCRAILPIVAKGRLINRNVVIVQTGDYDEIVGYAKTALEAAGARITSVIDIDRSFPFDNNERVARVLTDCGLTSPDPAKATDRLLGAMAEMLFNADYSYLPTKLEKHGVAKFTNSSFPTKARLFVLVGGATSENTNTSSIVDHRLIQAIARQNVTVVGCEGSSTIASYVPAWSKAGIATVDNADSAIGQIALICALNGEKAHFGTKETADRFIPLSLTEAK